MAELGEVGEVNKGGENWLSLSLDRRSKGLEVWVKVDPRVEEFIASISSNKQDSLEAFGRNWYGLSPENPIKVYSIEQEFVHEGYVLGEVCSSLMLGKSVNLSFLQFVGVGSPEGVRFIVKGPFEKEYLRSFKDKVLEGSRVLFKSYIVPVHISLRISSQEI